MTNIETKVRLDDLGALKSRVGIFASFAGNLKQKDTYFLLGRKRLKTREEQDHLELIYYDRKNTLEARESRYFLYHLNKIFFFLAKNTLRALFGIKKIVEKERYLYIYKNTRIHIDKVKNLGTFLELETVVKKEELYDNYKKEHKEVFAKLHLETMEKIPGSYSDFAANQV